MVQDQDAIYTLPDASLNPGDYSFAVVAQDSEARYVVADGRMVRIKPGRQYTFYVGEITRVRRLWNWLLRRPAVTLVWHWRTS